ncbi:DoxX family protein [Virgibacillus sediminis]|uniref:DoxX family protein n=1 Tax=Virgibacillus sediminis TaxID=202260 RepID=A0ABV7A9S4_9BACI
MKNEVGQLILRVVFGLIFFVHGLDKFQGGIANTAVFFDSLSIPGFLAYIVAIIELIGGLAMILGIGTRVIAILFAIIMLGAIFIAKFPAGLLGNGEMAGYELDLVLLATSIYFILADRIALSLDNKFSNSKQK